jgi:hypothetical protein
MVRRRSTVRFREGARTKTTRRRSSEAEQAAHNRRVGGSSPPAATSFDPGLNQRALRTEDLRMTHRYCPTCASEVEEVDGFCFLGHPLKLHADPASLTELREEVERAFERTEPPPERALVGVAARAAAASRTQPSAAAASGAPRPAAATPARGSSPSASSASPRPRPALDDPIAAFAPPPRMDWGPESPWRGALRRLNPTGRHSRSSPSPH